VKTTAQLQLLHLISAVMLLLQSLYGHGGGTVVFEPHDDLASCPEGSASPHTAQAAVVLLAGSSAAALKRSLNGMMLLYSRAGPDVRSAFHLYVGLDSEDAELRQIAESFAVDSMGAVKLVHHSSSGSGVGSKHVSDNKQYDAQQEIRQAATPAPAAGAETAQQLAARAGKVLATQRKLLVDAAPTSNSSSGSSTASTSSGAAGTSSSKQAAGQQPTAAAATAAVAAPVAQTAAAPAAAAASKPADASTSPSGHTVAASSSSSNPARLDHLRLMLHVFFKCLKYPAVLLLEDDMKLAPDFFEFYAATQWLLASDSSLYCLSAWNPVGYKQQRVSPRRIVRSDFSPGRGWMLSRQMGLQLLAAWPQGEAVDWQQHVRSSAVRGGRQCLAPELPRMVPAGEVDYSCTACGTCCVVRARQ
jgi:hypothetical protein